LQKAASIAIVTTMFHTNTKRARKLGGEQDVEPRACDWPGCDDQEGGVFKAPKSPQNLKSYRWFCLDHVREYNKSWNYYTNMDDNEVETDRRHDTVWHRPSWPLGANGAAFGYSKRQFNDAFGVFDDDDTPDPHHQKPAFRATTPEGKALQILDLQPPLTTEIVRARYKELVKRHHPDANDGDKASEEKFKQISQAYQTIMTVLAP